jgi:hypothetical protein
MSFIDIFNFKKYFSKPSDSQVARIGHVNAVYDTLNQPATLPYQVLILKVKITSTEPIVTIFENTLVNNTLLDVQAVTPLMLTFENPLNSNTFWGIAEGGTNAGPYTLVLIPEATTLLVGGASFLSEDDIFYIEIRIYE